jgi:hypothetical protein
MDRPVPLEGGVADLTRPAGQSHDLAGGPETVGGDGPHGVLQADDGGVGRLQFGAGQRQPLRIEVGFQTGDRRPGLGHGRLQPGGQAGVGGQDPYPGRAPEAPVECLEGGGGAGQTGRPGGQGFEGGVDVRRQRRGVGRGDGRPATQDGDDSTHGCEVSDAPGPSGRGRHGVVLLLGSLRPYPGARSWFTCPGGPTQERVPFAGKANP